LSISDNLPATASENSIRGTSKLYIKMLDKGQQRAWLQTRKIQYAHLSYDRCDLHFWPDASFR